MKPILLAALSSLNLATGAIAQFYDPASSAPPTVLLNAPRDWISYYHRKTKVETLLAGERLGYWEHKSSPDAAARARTAEQLAEELVKDYPRDAENWLLLANAKRLLGKHLEAAEAYVRTASISGFEPYDGWNAAVAYMKGGNKRAALDMIRGQIVDRGTMDRAFYFEAPEFAELHSDPEFLKLVGREQLNVANRDQGWVHDLDYLVAEVKRVNPEFRGRSLPPEFLSRYATLKRSVSLKSDEEMLVGVNWMLAALHQGHTQLFSLPAEGPVQKRSLPVRPYLFQDGLYVVNATPEYKDLVGAKILQIGGIDASEALRRAAAIQSVDGDMEYVLSSVVILSSAPFLKGLGLTSTTDQVDLTVQGKNGAVERRTVATIQQAKWGSRPIPPQFKAPLNNYDAMPYQAERPMPDRDAIYIQFNQVLDGQKESLPQFGKRLNSVIAKHNPHNIILDMRINSGGNGLAAAELLRTLIAFNRKPDHRLYVLVGRRTYSAATLFLSDLERMSDAILVGEATSECCAIHGDGSHVILPFSKIDGIVTAVNWNHTTAYDKRKEFSPDVPVQLTAADYFAGKDPALDAVYRLIDEDRRARRTH